MFNLLQKKRSKKIACLILAGVLLLSFISCRDSADVTETIGTLGKADSAFETAGPISTDTDPVSAENSQPSEEDPIASTDPEPSSTDTEPTETEEDPVETGADPVESTTEPAETPKPGEEPAPFETGSGFDPEPSVSDEEPKPTESSTPSGSTNTTTPEPEPSPEPSEEPDPEPSTSEDPAPSTTPDPEPTVSDKDPETSTSTGSGTNTSTDNKRPNSGQGNMDDSAALDEKPGDLTLDDIKDLTKNWDTYEFKTEVAQWVVYYINQYRAEQGVPALTVLPRMTLVAEYRADQIITDFSHNAADKREALAAYEYGEWFDATLVGRDASESYWKCNAREALGSIRPSATKTAQEIGKSLASCIRNSSSHWSYVGSGKYTYIAVGTEYEPSTYYTWFTCIMVSNENYG